MFLELFNSILDVGFDPSIQDAGYDTILQISKHLFSKITRVKGVLNVSASSWYTTLTLTNIA